MYNRLRAALERLWKSLAGSRGLVAVKTEHPAGDARAEARHRFWTELREGQREAEAHSRAR
jgi:hypothetical protein